MEAACSPAAGAAADDRCRVFWMRTGPEALVLLAGACSDGDLGLRVECGADAAAFRAYLVHGDTVPGWGRVLRHVGSVSAFVCPPHPRPTDDHGTVLAQPNAGPGHYHDHEYRLYISPGRLGDIAPDLRPYRSDPQALLQQQLLPRLGRVLGLEPFDADSGGACPADAHCAPQIAACAAEIADHVRHFLACHGCPLPGCQ